MRKRRRPGWDNKILFEVLVISASIAVTGILLSSFTFDTGFFRTVAEKAAIASTMTALPDKSSYIIRERFEDELDGEHQPSEPFENTAAKPPAQTEKPQKQEDAKKPEQENSQKKKQPPIPMEYRGKVIEEFFGVSTTAKNIYVKYKNAYIKNSTNLHNDKIEEILKEEWKKPKLDENKPLVLIYHTHATESFEEYDSERYDKRNTWRSTDNNNNITVVGDIMTEILERNGIGVIHDKTQHDYPSYNGSYERSAVTMSKYLEEYPSIQIALDIHRDAIQREDVLVKPVCNVDGKKVAQVMLIAGCDDGTMNMPNWKENLRFGAQFQNVLNEEYPGLARPLFFAYRKYNQDLCGGGLLLEVGSHGNTLDEVKLSGELIANALVKMLTGKDAKTREEERKAG